MCSDGGACPVLSITLRPGLTYADRVVVPGLAPLALPAELAAEVLARAAGLALVAAGDAIRQQCRAAATGPLAVMIWQGQQGAAGGSSVEDGGW